MTQREKWGTKLGVIMAVAGSAVGLGNFLRFPVQAAQHGGGAFMIPYFLAFILLGIPLMWIEWAIGRHGGLFGHGTAPFIFPRLAQNRFVKYLGVIGIFGPLVIFIYYIYIESWLLGYAFFALTGKLLSLATPESMTGFLLAYQGLAPGSNILTAYFFFLVTFVLNGLIIYRGIRGGIEKLCNIAMPLLFTFALIILLRVLSMGPGVLDGLGFLWNPDFSALVDAKVWLAAAGQVLFTLSVGIGVIMTYASYLSHGDDIVLSGLTAASTNESAEVVLGGSIVIPAAFAFLGVAGAQAAARSGAFNLGFVTMPVIFGHIPFGQIISFLWFALLFLAGITSSVSLMEPAVAFVRDEFRVERKIAAKRLLLLTFVLCQFPIMFLGQGVLDELDFWAGTFCLVVFATIEVFLFIWVFGMDKAWTEMHHGAELKIPRVYRFIMKYITPAFLLFVLVFWFIQQGWATILMQGVGEANRPYVLATRIGLIVLFAGIAYFVRKAWYNQKISGEIT
ncbi:sodium:calcium symporter [candidate division WOR-1 bacterium RIFCSPLOWO2_02_FULL_46_20]|uniref:Sodium:calcium symporter n=2 Tax=Saganbacteria TaxID=1703751 RepID=A0A1F4RD53_UNCSA|nr:MAG: sodium:calcium symporter [candidate division WOR-1 bacterium RIFCSPHIGHO2_02_FULL_45_12]OGC06056.1 MAG: sodium:calcium symporter [candidate division WOR-1 bacterium RIFCSPLOWO2_02_FULL_46_20]OGC09676.1 MAG: sodium:calcium symporter [candidate division WOR-1 bacterium RIFCSPLOWO2_12_FULL_45_9]